MEDNCAAGPPQPLEAGLDRRRRSRTNFGRILKLIREGQRRMTRTSFGAAIGIALLGFAAVGFSGAATASDIGVAHAPRVLIHPAKRHRTKCRRGFALQPHYINGKWVKTCTYVGNELPE
jgi:hypothetical protein